MLCTNPVGVRGAWGYLVAIRPRADRARRAGAVAGFATRLAGRSLVLVPGAGRARRARGRMDAAVRIANVRPRPCARTHAYRWLLCDGAWWRESLWCGRSGVGCWRLDYTARGATSDVLAALYLP